MSKILLKKYKNIDNQELLSILEKVCDEPCFLNEKRLLSELEILNYKEIIGIHKNDLIPLIDCYNNEFLIYDLIRGEFKMYSIDDDIIYDSKFIEDMINNILKKINLRINNNE